VRSNSKLVLVVATAAAGLVAANAMLACGGSDSTAVAPGDGGADTATTSPPPPPPPPPPPDDGGGDAADAGCVDDTACTTSQGTLGLCKSGVCSACSDPADDTACKTAYGATVDGGALLCNKGVCAPGDCRVNSDCAGAKICGLNVANTCAGCAGNNDCSNSYGAGYICNTTTGGCVTSASVCTNPDAGACTGIPGDVCCVPAGGDAGACVVGTCCSDTQCNTGAGEKCLGNKCTGCDAPTDTYVVDPANGDDTTGSGSGLQGSVATASCAFKTITRAVQAIGNGKVAPVTILIKTGTTTFGALETFPITVPPFVTVKSQDTANPATIQVPAGKRGFVLPATSSGLSYLVIDGQAKTATDGVVALTGSSSTTTKLDHLTVKDFQNDGIRVANSAGLTSGGGLAVGPGVVATGNGGAGLDVRDNGVAVVTGTDGAKTHFDSNQQGIHVTNAGQLTLTGAPGATPLTTATVTTNANLGVGLVIDQTPSATATAPPLNAITGLTAWNTTTGAGVRLHAGSNVKLRSSTALGNATAGVHIFSFASVPVTNDVSHLDLGVAGDYGLNVLQAPSSADAGAPPANTGAGICLQVTANAGQILSALGNTLVSFAKPVTAVDCSSAATAAKVSSNTTCTLGVAVAVLGPANNSDVINANLCTQ
jgi:hypothetical protein